jgi:hypothetical protein
MAKAGVLVASEGLNPAAAPARVVRAGDKRTVVDGPYAEAKELIGGFSPTSALRTRSRFQASEPPTAS